MIFRNLINAEDKNQEDNFFWGMILFGGILPVVVMSTTELISDPREFFDFISSVFPGLVLMGIFNSIPFVVLAYIARTLWIEPAPEKYQSFYQHTLGVIFVGVITSVADIIFLISIVISPGNSTSAIGYPIILFLLLVAQPFEYGFGWLTGKIIKTK